MALHILEGACFVYDTFSDPRFCIFDSLFLTTSIRVVLCSLGKLEDPNELYDISCVVFLELEFCIIVILRPTAVACNLPYFDRIFI